ncbi:MAG: AMP-binding protein, partial [Nocardioidaceae bacterium]
MPGARQVSGVRDVSSITVEDRYDALTVRRFREAGWWRDRHLTAHLDEWAESAPGRTFAGDGKRSVTYSELQGAAYRLGESLVDLGIGPGDRVIVQLPNWVEFAIAYLAITRIGAVLVPIMTIYRDDEVRYIADHSGAVAAFTTGEFRGFDHARMFRGLRSRCPALRDLIIVRGDREDGEHHIDDLTARGSADPGRLGPTPGSDQPHVIGYTSGTESRPKGCLHTWNTYGFSARGLAHSILRLTAEDTVFMPSPVAHSTGLVVGVCSPIVAGCGTHLLDVWEPSVGLERIARYGCTVTATATPFARMAIDAYRPGEHDLRSMRLWLCAGAPIPSSLVGELTAVFTGCSMVPLWGCSEFLAGTCCTLEDPIEAVTGSDGRPALDGVEIRVVDPEGVVVAEGGEGELLYRGPGGLLGYWRDPERTAAAIDTGGWYHSGDLAIRKPGGYVRVSGRIKDLIIRGGVNISALEVEEHLESHPKVSSAAVVGYPDERLGEKACAFVVPSGTEPPTLEELTSYLRTERRIAVHKLPERLEVVDSLPVTASGKVQKFE